MKKLLYTITILMFCMTTLVYAEQQRYVAATAELPEIVTPAPFVVTEQFKNAAATYMSNHLTVTRHEAKKLLKRSGQEVQMVLDALVAEGIIKRYEDRYNELYNSGE